MEKINERLKELRTACKKNQRDFGKVLGISSSGIADIENGRRNVTEKHLIMLSNWEEYNVNIDWLRTGTGDMFLPAETDTLETLRREYNLTDRQFRFVANFLRLPENEKDIIFDYFSSVFSDRMDIEETAEDRIEREVADYRRELELEERRAEKSLAFDDTDAKKRKEA